MTEADDMSRVITYNPLTGDFTWAVSRPGAKFGAIAGSITAEGYRQVRINRKVYSSHRLAWFFINGKWPNGEIDHINGNRLDNKASNLRVVDRSVNSQNKRSAMKNNKSCGLLGVTWNKQHKKWQSKIMVNKKSHHVGLFDCPEEAHSAYLRKKRVLHAGCTI